MIHKHKHRFVCNFEYPQIPHTNTEQFERTKLLYKRMYQTLNKQWPFMHTFSSSTYQNCFCLLQIFAMFISFAYRSLNTRARNTWCVQVTLHVHVKFWDTFHTASLHVQKWKLDSSAIGKLGHLGFQRILVVSNKTHIYF